jgi:hypothetical protein
LRYLRENLSALLEPHLRGELATPNSDPLKLAAATQYTVKALVGILAWWAETDVSYAVEEIYDTFRQLTTNGVNASSTRNEPPTRKVSVFSTCARLTCGRGATLRWSARH